MEESKYKPKYPVQTLEKALEILNYLKENTASNGISISEISEQLQLGKSSVHRILDTLYASNYIEKASNGSYRLGWELFDIGNKIPLQHNLNHTEYAPLLESLCAKCSETVNLAIINQDSIVIIYKIEPNIRLRSNVQVGGQEPLHCTSLGKLFFSEMKDYEIYDFYHAHKTERFTPNTITSPGKMLVEVRKIREQGYSVDNEEYCEGLTCIGAPIRDFTGKIIAAISLSGPSQRMNGPKLESNLAELTNITERLSIFMGYKVYEK